MRNQKSKLDIAIKACQDTLEKIKQQQEFNKFLLTEHRCPTCGTVYYNKEDADFIDEAGMCYRCDHVKGEVTDDLHNEVWDGETSEDKWATDAYIEGSFGEGN